MMRSNTYALVEEVEQGPLFTGRHRIIREKGNKKAMERARKAKTEGTWMIYITTKPMGYEVV